VAPATTHPDADGNPDNCAYGDAHVNADVNVNADAHARPDNAHSVVHRILLSAGVRRGAIGRESAP
jgi:hypothetical protein